MGGEEEWRGERAVRDEEVGLKLSVGTKTGLRKAMGGFGFGDGRQGSVERTGGEEGELAAEVGAGGG